MFTVLSALLLRPEEVGALIPGLTVLNRADGLKLHNGLQRLLIGFRGDHVVVCGLGYVGFEFVRQHRDAGYKHRPYYQGVEENWWRLRVGGSSIPHASIARLGPMPSTRTRNFSAVRSSMKVSDDWPPSMAYSTAQLTPPPFRDGVLIDATSIFDKN